MAPEIVHDDDVAWSEAWDEQLFDIGAEALAINRPIEYARRGQSVATQRAEERHGAPVAMRREAAQASAPGRPSTQRNHVGLDPCLIDKDQASRIEAGLPRSPAAAPAGDIGTALFKSEQRFF